MGFCVIYKGRDSPYKNIGPVRLSPRFHFQTHQSPTFIYFPQRRKNLCIFESKAPIYSNFWGSIGLPFILTMRIIFLQNI